MKKKSSDRISKEPKFTEILKNIEESKKNKGVIKLAELRKKAAEEDLKKKDEKGDKKEEKSRKAKMKETVAPLVTEGVNIMVDWLKTMKPVAATQTAAASTN